MFFDYNRDEYSESGVIKIILCWNDGNDILVCDFVI